jgi:hypothetical protein
MTELHVELTDQECEPDLSQEQIEEMWQYHMRGEIERDKPIIPTYVDVEELNDVFQSYAHTLMKMKEVRDSGQPFCEVDEQIFTSIQTDILSPIVARMKELGEYYWVSQYEKFAE